MDKPALRQRQQIFGPDYKMLREAGTLDPRRPHSRKADAKFQLILTGALRSRRPLTQVFPQIRVVEEDLFHPVSDTLRIQGLRAHGRMGVERRHYRVEKFVVEVRG